MKKNISLVITLVMLFSILVVGSPINAQVNEKVNQDEITFSDLEVGPGPVEMDEIPEDLRKKLESRIKEIDMYFEKLGDAEVELDMLKEKKEVSTFSVEDKIELQNAEEKFQYLEKNSYEIAGLIKLEEEDSDDIFFDIMSDEDDVAITRPSVYWDTDSQMYVINGGWKWNQTYHGKDPGGRDGFGLRVNQERISYPSNAHGLRTYDEYGTRYTPSLALSTSSYGVGMRFQDFIGTQTLAETYSAYRGQAWLYFTFYDGIPYGKTTNFVGAYAHTWDKTEVDSISIGRDSFNISFRFGSDGWDNEAYSGIRF
ncbi:MAG: hypothetical protein JJT76_14935 [Clostridiaceae bacterium]|nr:hypothetical protein [Clostridiaceae bacterium]